MKKRRESLQQLETTFQCSEKWEAMSGSAGCRFCAACQREVIDLAQLTPFQARAHLEAARGKLCARVTRDGSRIRFAEMTAGSSSRPRLPGRANPLAATLLGALLGVGSLAAQPASPAAPAALSSGKDQPEPTGKRKMTPSRLPAADASLSGRVQDQNGEALIGAEVLARQIPNGPELRVMSDENGKFVFPSLPAGLYDLEANLEGFEVFPSSDLILEPGQNREHNLEAVTVSAHSITMGQVMIPALPLRYLFEASDLVVVAVVEGSEVAKDQFGTVHVLTRLRIKHKFKGTFHRRTLIYRHFEAYAPTEDLATEGTYGEGEELLAFLTEAEMEAGTFGANRHEFQATNYHRGVRKLSSDERAAYFASLEGLAALEKRSAGQGMKPADLMDWLVTTAENPYTREEVRHEIALALISLEGLAEHEGRTEEELARLLVQVLAESEEDADQNGENLRPMFLAAVFTEEHRQRLLTALLSNPNQAEEEEYLLELLQEK